MDTKTGNMALMYGAVAVTCFHSSNRTCRPHKVRRSWGRIWAWVLPVRVLQECRCTDSEQEPAQPLPSGNLADIHDDQQHYQHGICCAKIGYLVCRHGTGQRMGDCLHEITRICRCHTGKQQSKPSFFFLLPQEVTDEQQHRHYKSPDCMM